MSVFPSVASALRIVLSALVLTMALAQSAIAQTWIQLTPNPTLPTGRLYNPPVYNPATNRMVIFSGYPIHTPGNLQNDLWILSGANGIGTPSWTQAIPPFFAGSPSARFGYSAAYDQQTNRMMMFGGWSSGTVLNDMWVLRNADGTTGAPTWQQIFPGGASPAARNNHSSVYDAASNRMIVFGGFATQNCPCALLNDVWVLTNANGIEASTPTWIHLAPSGTLPTARSNFLIGYDPTSNRLVTFGGVTGSALNVVLGDQWVLTNANGLGGAPAWQQVTATGTQPALAYPGGAYDSSTNRLIVFGGLAQTNLGAPSSNATWILTNANGLGGASQWHQLAIPGSLPIDRDSATTAYDPSTNRLIVFSGEQHQSAFTLNDTWVLTSANGVSTPLAITQLVPNHGGNSGVVTVRTIGGGFQNGATITLNGPGPDIIGSSVSVQNNSTVAATFGLTGATAGSRSVVVCNPDGSSVTLEQGFTVEEGGAADIRVAIIGRDKIRAGREQTYYLVVSNEGNVDGSPGLVSLSVPPVVGYAQVFGSSLFAAGAAPASEFIDPRSTQAPDGVALLFASPGVPVSNSQQAAIQLALPTTAAFSQASVPSSFTANGAWQSNLTTLNFGDYLGLAGTPFQLNTACVPCFNSFQTLSTKYGRAGDAYRAWQHATFEVETSYVALPLAVAGATAAIVLVQQAGLPVIGGAVLGAILSEAQGCALTFLSDDASLHRCLNDLRSHVETAGDGIIDYLLENPNLSKGTKELLSGCVTKLQVLIAAIDPLGDLIDARAAVKAARGIYEQTIVEYLVAWNAYQKCQTQNSCPISQPAPPPLLPWTDSLTVTGVTSLDPNDKSGPRGVGVERYLSGAAPLSYAVQFSNEETASAPAQDVLITDQLDTTKVELPSVSLGPISFGNQLITPPPFQTTFATIVDLRPEQDLLVAIKAQLNTSSGLLTWSLKSLDPLTGLPPTDPTAGFLPPSGEGSLFFTVMPKHGLPTETPIQNQATIVFDINAAIPTPTWTNRLDSTLPVSHVLTLPTTENSTSFAVNWTGTDLGSGVQDFTIYVSDNSGPFSALLSNTAVTSATFSGQTGHTYGFFSLARDLVGNVELAKTVPEAATQVMIPIDTTPPIITPHVTGTLGSNGWYSGDVIATWDVNDPESGIVSSSGCGETTLTTDTGGVTLTCTATNGVGLSTSVSVRIKIDETAPSVTVTPSTTTVWPPNGKTIPVLISGSVTDSASGVDPSNIGFVVTDEYGVVQPSGMVTLTLDGHYSFTIPLQASRLGSDNDGRLYTIAVTAKDKAGNQASRSTAVTVPHDQGK